MDEEFLDDFQEKPSKSALKRAHKERQKMVDNLCKLRNEKFKKLNLPERIAEELVVARNMKPSSARNRQIRFVTSLMSELDEDQIAKLEAALG